MWLCVFLLYSVLQESSGCTVERGLGDTITKSVGDSVELLCSCTKQTKVDPQTVQWGFTRNFMPGKYRADHSVFPEDGSQNQNHRGRVQRLNQNKPGTVSLIISHLTEEDEGTYLCGNKEYNRAVTLQVSTGCAVLDHWSRTFSRSPGESVLLPCPCPGDQKINTQTVRWSFSKTGTKDETERSIDTESYRGRVWMFNQNHSRNFSLLISDLTKEDTGHYTCTADEKDMPYVQLEVKGCALSENKQTVPVSRSSGESVLLSCTCTDQQDRPVRVQWRTPNHEDLLQRYSGRVQTFNQSSPGNLSVLISDLTEEDRGTYSCWINQNQYRNFRLTVKGCTVERGLGDTITKSVGDSVVLPCSCTDLQDNPQKVKWGFTTNFIIGNYTAEQNVFPEDGSQNQRRRNRVQRLNQNPPGNLSLIISHLTEEDEGTYLCGVSRKYSSFVFLYVRGCTVLSSRERSFTRSLGESVLLPCPCPGEQKISPEKVTWSFSKTETEDPTAVCNDTESYRGRVWMFDQTHSRNFSLLISDLTEEDTGYYECRVDDNYRPYIHLEVKGCTLSETQEKLIIRYPGESVLLPCSCTDQHTKPASVKWEHVDSGGTEVSNETANYTSRVHMFNKNLPANLSLLIFNLAEQDQGTYRCSINNKQSINISLNITAGKRDITESTAEKRNIMNQFDFPDLLIALSVCVALLLIVVIGESALILKLRCNRTQGSVSTNTERGTQNTADGDYENDPPGNHNNIGMGPIYQSLDPNTNQSDSVYQSLNPNTNQSDSVYQSINPNNNQPDSIYQSQNSTTIESDSAYQSSNPNTNQSDSV